MCYDNIRLQIDGKLYRHGPRDRPCIGSGTLPHQGSVHPSQDAHDSTQNSQSQSSQFNVTCSNYNAMVSPAITDSTTNVINDSFDVQSYNEFVHPTRGSPPVKRIPRSARLACSTLLSKLLNDVAEDAHSVDKWQKLFSFAPNILSKPKRGGRKRNLGNLITSRISKFPDKTINDQMHQSNPRFGCGCNGDQVRSKAAIAKLEDGNICAAVKILSSNDEPAADNIETLNALYAKHPGAPADLKLLDRSVTEQFVPLQVSDEDVRLAISSFPPGSAGGLDSILPQHLKDLIGNDEDQSLLPNITKLINVMLDGSLPDSIAKIIHGGNLIALTKKSGGIRPITIGYVYRRIAAKCANKYALN